MTRGTLLLLLLAAAAGFSAAVPARAAPAPGDGSLVRIALPVGLERRDLVDPTPAVRGRLRAAARAALAALPDPGGDEPLDRIIGWTDVTGRLIRPDRARAAGAAASATAITFTFDSPDHPWTETELALLQRWVAALYPEIVAVYGNPAFTMTVNVVNEPGDPSHSGSYTPATNEIALYGDAGLRPRTLAHEIAHAFHDEDVILFDAFEEGMARAVEYAVGERVFLGGLHHSSYYCVFYEPLNQPGIGNESFWAGEGLTSIRYELGGYAWGKVCLERPSFFRDFNALLYVGAAAADTLCWWREGLLAIAAEAAPTVEGLPFLDWARGQHILDPDGPAGPLVYQEIESYLLHCFTRDARGNERAAAGLPVRWTVYDCDDVPILRACGGTSSRGLAGLPYGQLREQRGRLRVEATVSYPASDVTSTAWRLAEGPEGFCGVVPGAGGGTVTITPRDAAVPAVAAPIVLGGFAVPGLADAAGGFELRLECPGGAPFTRFVTKDSASYMAVLDAPAAALPARRGTLAARPAVTRAATRFVLDGPSPGAGTLSILDVAGRRLRSIPVAGGDRAGDWDGLADAGARARSGVYFARWSAPGLDATARAVIVR